MYDYLFLMDNIHNGCSHEGCRELLVGDYRELMENYSRETRLKTNLYFGHCSFSSMDTEDIIVGRYLPYANLIWNNRVTTSIIKVKDITDSPDVNELKGYYGDLSLLRTSYCVNPMDVSFLLYLTWFGEDTLKEDNEHNELRMYMLGKLNGLIPNGFHFYKRDEDDYHCDGPESFIWYLQEENRQLYDQLFALLEQNKGVKLL